MRKPKILIFAAIVGCLVTCHFQGRKFFVSHLWRAHHTAPLAGPSSKFVGDSAQLFVHASPASLELRKQMGPQLSNTGGMTALTEPKFFAARLVVWPPAKSHPLVAAFESGGRAPPSLI